MSLKCYTKYIEKQTEVRRRRNQRRRNCRNVAPFLPFGVGEIICNWVTEVIYYWETVVTVVERNVCEIVFFIETFISDKIGPIACQFGFNLNEEPSYNRKNALFFAKVSDEVYKDNQKLGEIPNEIWRNGENQRMITDVNFIQECGFGIRMIPFDTQLYVFELKEYNIIRKIAPQTGLDLNNQRIPRGAPLKNTLVIAFRGSENMDEFVNFDLNGNMSDWISVFAFQPYLYTKLGVTVCKIHAGFATAYFNVKEELFQNILKRDLNTFDEIVFTGHSLGGALSTLALFDFKCSINSDIPISNYTYGSPMVGDEKFANDFNNINQLSSYRHVNSADIATQWPFLRNYTIVPGIPFSLPAYRHVNSYIYLERQNSRFSGNATIEIEPCPKPYHELPQQIGTYLPFSELSGVEVWDAGLHLFFTLIPMISEDNHLHEMDEYISIIEEGEIINS